MQNNTQHPPCAPPISRSVTVGSAWLSKSSCINYSNTARCVSPLNLVPNNPSSSSSSSSWTDWSCEPPDEVLTNSQWLNGLPPRHTKVICRVDQRQTKTSDSFLSPKTTSPHASYLTDVMGLVFVILVVKKSCLHKARNVVSLVHIFK